MKHRDQTEAGRSNRSGTLVPLCLLIDRPRAVPVTFISVLVERVFELGRYLVPFTGDAKYADWIERVLIDGIGASIPMSLDGSVFYFSDYSIDGVSKANLNPWSCCAGTRPMAAADFHDLVYFHDDANLYVTLFAPSSVT
ncbi:MAG: hypothetical protein ABSH05_15465 [Bryobacteraceae bacterium]